VLSTTQNYTKNAKQKYTTLKRKNTSASQLTKKAASPLFQAGNENAALMSFNEAFSKVMEP
jgi:hypothetical protein